MSSSSAWTRARMGPDPCAAGPSSSPAGFAPHARHQAQAPARGVRGRDALRRYVTKALPLDVVRREARAHGHVGQRRGFAGGIPAVDVVSRVRLRVPVGLGPGERLAERAAPGDGVDDDVGRRVEHGLEAEQAAVREGDSSRLNTGRPSITVLSKRMRRPAAAAAAATRRQFQAIGPLLAVTTSMPSAKACSMCPRGDRGVVLLHHGQLDEHVGGRGGQQFGRGARRVRRGRRRADGGEGCARREPPRRQKTRGACRPR